MKSQNASGGHKALQSVCEVGDGENEEKEGEEVSQSMIMSTPEMGLSFRSILCFMAN